MKKGAKHYLFLALGWIFIFLGILGLFLPILQGILFLAIGLDYPEPPVTEGAACLTKKWVSAIPNIERYRMTRQRVLNG